uniref:Uncharacterized protein n=1 Tax=Arundo donax TaxID=35708 RepID=A0A0A8YWV6_ARUDO
MHARPPQTACKLRRSAHHGRVAG